VARKLSRRVRLETALNSVESPVFLIDARRRVAFLNRGGEQLTGWTLADVGSSICEFVSDVETSHVEELTSALCPPPDAFESPSTPTPRFFVHRETRETASRLVHFFPLKDEDGTVFVLGVVTDPPKARATPERSILTDVHAELAALRHSIRERFSLSSLVAKCRSMLRVLRQIDVARGTKAAVHISGPAGSGRDHIARVIHYESPSSAKAFVPVDCRNVPARELRESIGRLVQTDWAELSPVEALQPGCLCFFHVDEMPRDVQERFLNFVESDSAAAFRDRVRIVSTSDSGLDAALHDERLLERLYFLLTPLPIPLPPLAERGDDLLLLAQHFLERENRGRSLQVSGFADDVQRKFAEYTWPGNLDELRAVVTEAAATCDESTVRLSHLPFRFRTGLDGQQLGPKLAVEPLDEMLARIEREHLEAALRQATGNKAQAARLLGLTRASFYRRLQNHGLVGNGE
jgi:DNA-binding NtrC family response regulator